MDSQETKFEVDWPGLHSHISNIFMDDLRREEADEISRATKDTDVPNRPKGHGLAKRISQSTPGGRHFYNTLKGPRNGQLHSEPQAVARHGLDFWASIFEWAPVDTAEAEVFLHDNPTPFPRLPKPSDEHIEGAIDRVLDGYLSEGGPDVVKRFNDIRGRVRYHG